MNSVQIIDSAQATPPSPAEPLGGAFAALGRFIARRPWAVIAVFLVFLAATGVMGSRVFSELQASGYDDPSSESQSARDFAEQEFGLYGPPVVLVVETKTGVDSPEAEQAALALQAEVAKVAEVTDTVSFWSAGKPDQLASADRSEAQLLVYADGASPEQQMELARTISDDFSGKQGDLTIQVGGFGADGDGASAQQRMAMDGVRREMHGGGGMIDAGDVAFAPHPLQCAAQAHAWTAADLQHAIAALGGQRIERGLVLPAVLQSHGGERQRPAEALRIAEHAPKSFARLWAAGGH